MFIITRLTQRPSVWTFSRHCFLNYPRKSCFRKNQGEELPAVTAKIHSIMSSWSCKSKHNPTHTHTHTHTSWGAATQKNKPEKRSHSKEWEPNCNKAGDTCKSRLLGLISWQVGAARWLTHLPGSPFFYWPGDVRGHAEKAVYYAKVHCPWIERVTSLASLLAFSMDDPLFGGLKGKKRS